MADTDERLVLEIGWEGGGLSLFREWVQDRRLRYWTEGTTMDLDENDDERWREIGAGPVETWDEAVKLLGESWSVCHPIRIHPDFRSHILRALEEEVKRSRDNDREYFERRMRRRWEEALAGGENSHER